MSLHDPKKYLYDIINCSDFVLKLTKDKTVEDYKHDRVFRSAQQDKREALIISCFICIICEISG